MEQNRGKFIVFEGIDGSGKSTQAKRLAKKLQEQGIKVWLTCEPTYSRIGQIIRDIFTHKMEADTHTVAGLFVADRLHHILEPEEGILAKLAKGYIVISDRYYFSSYAYQGAHVDMEWVIAANQKCAELLRPDLNIFIDVAPEVSMKRIEQGRSSTELYESLQNLIDVRKAYLKAFDLKKEEETILTIFGEEQIDTLAEKINTEIQRRFLTPS